MAALVLRVAANCSNTACAFAAHGCQLDSVHQSDWDSLSVRPGFLQGPTVNWYVMGGLADAILANDTSGGRWDFGKMAYGFTLDILHHQLLCRLWQIAAHVWCQGTDQSPMENATVGVFTWRCRMWGLDCQSGIHQWNAAVPRKAR